MFTTVFTLRHLLYGITDAVRLRKLERKMFQEEWENAVGRKLSRESVRSCQRDHVRQSLSESSRQRDPAREFLSESSCQRVPVRERLSERGCQIPQRDPVRDLSWRSCQRDPVREILSERGQKEVRKRLSEREASERLTDPVREILSERIC